MLGGEVVGARSVGFWQIVGVVAACKGDEVVALGGGECGIHRYGHCVDPSAAPLESEAAGIPAPASAGCVLMGDVCFRLEAWSA